MSTSVDTDQRSREATGAHPYGRYFEEFEVGAVYKHWPAKTVTEADDHLFCLITMNHHPLHINDVYAAQSQQGRNVVVGPYVYSLALGMSVSDISGKAIANLATEELSHPAPVFHGDTLFAETEVLEVRESRSKPDRGTVKVHTRVLNQDGVLVAEFKRLVLVPSGHDHLCVRYEIDPDKIEDFERFAQAWIDLVNRHGGTHHGYFLPRRRQRHRAGALRSELRRYERFARGSARSGVVAADRIRDESAGARADVMRPLLA